MSRAVYIVDAFAARPYAGNAAGVITAAEGLEPAQMQAIARELGQTETCFVRTTPNAETDFQLRWFTPTVEVDLCGHATVAAYLCLAREGRLPLEGGSCQLRHLTRSGILDVWVTRAEGSATVPAVAPVVMMSAGVARVGPASDERHRVAGVVGLEPSDLDPELPLGFEEAGARLIVPVRSLERLLALRPALAEMVAYGGETGYRRFTLVCRETRDPGSIMHLRHFAPANGIPEDPVTGTAHAAVAVYLDWQGLLPPGDVLHLRGEQGHAVNRPGTVAIELRRAGGTLVDVRIGGSGFIVSQGTIADP